MTKTLYAFQNWGGGMPGGKPIIAAQLAYRAPSNHFPDVGKMVRRSITGNQFTARVKRPVPQWRSSTEQVTDPLRLESRLESRLAARLMLLLAQVEAGKRELAHQLGHQSVSGELHKQIRRLLDAEFIAMTLPDKPNSRLQQYRLTDAGQRLVQQIKNEAQP